MGNSFPKEVDRFADCGGRQGLDTFRSREGTGSKTLDLVRRSNLAVQDVLVSLRGWVQGQWARTRRPQDTDHFRLERTRDRRRAISIGLIAGAVAGLGVMAFGEVGDRSLQPLGASFTVGVDDNGARYIAIEPAALSTESDDHDPAKAGGEWHGSPVLLFRVEGQGATFGYVGGTTGGTHSTTPPPPPGNNPGPQPNPQPLPGPLPSPGPAPSPDPRPTPRPSPAPDPSPTIDPSPTVDPSPTPDPSPTVDPPLADRRPSAARSFAAPGSRAHAGSTASILRRPIPRLPRTRLPRTLRPRTLRRHRSLTSLRHPGLAAALSFEPSPTS